MMYYFKVEEASMDILQFTKGTRPNLIIAMVVMEIIYITSWIISVIMLLFWYFITNYKSPFQSSCHCDKANGAKFWVDKECDDYLRFVQRQIWEQGFTLNQAIIALQLSYNIKNGSISKQSEPGKEFAGQYINMLFLFFFRMSWTFYIDYYYRSINNEMTALERKNFRNGAVCVKIIVSYIFIAIWYFLDNPGHEYNSIFAELWTKIEVLYFIIEPFYFQIFLKWLNSRSVTAAPQKRDLTDEILHEKHHGD